VSGECGVLAAIKPGKSFVDMSSVEVETATELYEVCSQSSLLCCFAQCLRMDQCPQTKLMCLCIGIFFRPDLTVAVRSV